MNLFTPAGREADDASHMVIFAFQLPGFYLAVGSGSLISERFVKDYNKVVLKVFGYSAVVLGGVTYNLVFFGNYLYVRAVVESIDHYIRFLVLGESKAEQCRTAGGRQFRHHIMVCQVHLVIVRFHHFRLVRKPTGAFVLVKHRLAGHRHDGELSVVVNPRAGLVGLLEATDLVGIISVCPSVAHGSCLCCPEVHPPRQGDGRIRVTGGQGMFGL